jgi:hypothetical protein
MKIGLVFLAAAACGSGLFAQAQMSCTASVTNPANLRSSGLAELGGDLVITCTGGTPVTSGAVPTVNVNMFFNTSVTSRILAPGPPPLTEALLILDTPTASQQVPCLVLTCTTENIFQGRNDSFNSLSWTNVPINPPGPNAQRLIRFKNIRLNAVNLSVNSSALVFISMTGSQVGTLSSPQQNLGVVRTGVTVEVRSPNDGALTGPVPYVACTGFNSEMTSNAASIYGSPGGRSANLKFSEPPGFPTAFKRRFVNTTASEPLNVASQENLSFNYTTESGFTNMSFPAVNGLNRVGQADTGTILRAVFSNIPAGVRLYVSVQNLTAGSTLGTDGTPSTKARLTGSPGAPFTAVAADSPSDGGLRQVPSSGEVNWEILETDSNNTESVTFAVAIAFSGNPQPQAGPINYATGFGAGFGSASSSATDPLPRFNGALQPAAFAVINACRTTLLFQFLTNQAGFDTGVAVSNTSRDTLGTTPQSGRCTATFFPTPFNPTTQAQFQPLSSNTLNGGEQWTFTLSGARPGFQGYMLVGCDFQFAHGYAFISDFGSQKLAQGYQALIIPDRPRAADPLSTAPSGSGEQLAH